MNLRLLSVAIIPLCVCWMTFSVFGIPLKADNLITIKNTGSNSVRLYMEAFSPEDPRHIIQDLGVLSPGEVYNLTRHVAKEYSLFSTGLNFGYQFMGAATSYSFGAYPIKAQEFEFNVDDRYIYETSYGKNIFGGRRSAAKTRHTHILAACHDAENKLCEKMLDE